MFLHHVFSFCLLVCAGLSSQIQTGTEPVVDSLRSRFARAAAFDYAHNAQVTENFIRYSDYGSGNDVLLLQLYNAVLLPDAEVERLLSLFKKGAWRDINYADQTRGRWNPTLHLTRMLSLTKLYTNPASAWCGDKRLHDLLHQGLAYWCSTRPQCPNWWHNNIGVPKKLGSILLMIYNELSPEELQAGLEVMDQAYFGKTGQNKVWLAANKLMEGLLRGDLALVEKARNTIAEEIGVTTQEGLQPDHSFHQHGPQIQFGNYGLTYIDVLSFWFRVLEGSPYAFDFQHVELLSQLMYRGIGRSIWRGVMDPSYCGRQNFINGGRGKGYAFAVAAQNMAALDIPGSEDFARLSAACLEPSAEPQPATGATYYYRSDCGIYRTPQWYASIRMHSERTVGFEFTNRENTLANFSADGALLLMQHGCEFENIFAHWDWRKVPGTTTYRDHLPIKCVSTVEGRANHSLWVAGAVQDEVLATTMELKRDSLHAFKSNFFFPDAIISLGAGIHTEQPNCLELSTSLDQTHLAGEVQLGKGKRLLQTLPQSTQVEGTYDKADWLWHDNRGFVLLSPARLQVSTSLQGGKWDWIDPYYVEAVDQGRVFKASLQHEIDAPENRYAYVTLPTASAEATARFAQEKPVELLSNTPACQAVAYQGTLCAVFQQGGSLQWGKNSLSVDKPVVLILQGHKLSLASPFGGEVEVKLTFHGQSRNLRLNLPTDDAHRGQTLTQTL